MDTLELISRCKAGEKAALHLLYERYRPRLLAVCRLYTKDDNVAEDLLHDAFVVILTSLHQLRDADKLESWMATIVHNTGRHYQRQTEKEQTAIRQMASETREQAGEHSQSQAAGLPDAPPPDYDQLQSLVALLPQGYQQVFRLSVFEGLSHREIGQILGISPHSSSSQLSHAKRMLRLLIRQSWVLVLLLIAIPAGIWQMLKRAEPKAGTDSQLKTSDAKKPRKPAPPPERTDDKPAYAAVGRKAVAPAIRYQTEAVIAPDSIPYGIAVQADTLTETAQAEAPQEETREPLTIPTVSQPDPFSGEDIAKAKAAKPKWDIRLAYNGQTGGSVTGLSPTAIHTTSFASESNAFVPSGYSINNWIDYSWALNNANLAGAVSPETRSLMMIAAKNAALNHGEMTARHDYRPPLTIQLTLSRQLTSRLSVETGLSYTQMKSTSMTGSTTDYIEERRWQRYLGIPLRFGWRWYGKAHLSLYSSAGAMLELPLYSTLDVEHINGGIGTYNQKSRLSVPVQWSASFGFGVQYDLTPHLGLYVEPSLQYFFDDGSDLKSYRTEHPLGITLPLGIRFHW